MKHLLRLLLFCLCLTLTGISRANEPEIPQLPDWEVLEFEEKAFWATARSRLGVLADPENIGRWKLSVDSSVVDNSEKVHVDFDPTSGQAYTRSRLSQGKQQRLKSYRYEADFIVRERRNPAADENAPPEDWPITYSGEVSYPATAADTVVTGSYLLFLLAQQLQDQGPENSLEVLVHTDLNFYRVRLTSGNGIPIDVDYSISGEGPVSGMRETLAVAMKVTPEGTLAEDSDFSFLGLQGQIILFFDRDSGLPLQVRGVAPRIGTSEINLKSVTMRKPR
jgi:hypothetical protein